MTLGSLGARRGTSEGRTDRSLVVNAKGTAPSVAARGTVQLLLARGCFVATGYVISVILARGLGPADYGIYGVVMSLLRLRPQLIVFNWWHPFFGMAYGSIIQLLELDLRRRVCFLCHNVRPHETHFLERILCQYAFRHVEYFIVHSEEDKRTLLRLKPASARAAKWTPGVWAVLR